MAQNRTLVCRGEAIPEVERLELLNLVRMRRHRFKEPGLGLSLVRASYVRANPHKAPFRYDYANGGFHNNYGLHTSHTDSA